MKILLSEIFKKICKNVLTIYKKNSILNLVGRHGRLAQLGEHLPYKQRVIGSSPIGPIHF